MSKGWRIFERIVAEEGQRFLGWRQLKTDNSLLGAGALSVEPLTYHAFVGRGEHVGDQDRFERKLYVIRKRLEGEIEHLGLADRKFFYFSSLSSRTLVYKGMLTPQQLPAYFADDLGDERLASASACFTHGSAPIRSRAGSLRTPIG